MSSAPFVSFTLSRIPMPPLLDLCHSLDPVAFARERLRFLPDPTQSVVRKAAPPRRPPPGDGGNKISLLLPNGSRIVGLPGTEATDRGYSGVRVLLVDEDARVDEDL
jgi:hypothetical protein